MFASIFYSWFVMFSRVPGSWSRIHMFSLQPRPAESEPVRQFIGRLEVPPGSCTDSPNSSKGLQTSATTWLCHAVFKHAVWQYGMAFQLIDHTSTGLQHESINSGSFEIGWLAIWVQWCSLTANKCNYQKTTVGRDAPKLGLEMGRTMVIYSNPHLGYNMI